MCWKRRVAEGPLAVCKPGPKKIADLSHGNQRSHGTGHLYSAFKDVISRRDLVRMVGHNTNLNHPAVNDTLADALVIQINNPVAMAFYNGATENS